MTNYSYDRTFTGSETPSFDGVIKANLEPKLGVAARKAAKIADKVEDVLRDSRTPWRSKRIEVLKNLLSEQAQVAYVVLDLLRPVLVNGRREAPALKSKDAENLSNELRLLDGYRNALLGFHGEDSYDPAWETLTHTAAMSISYVLAFYKQLK